MRAKHVIGFIGLSEAGKTTAAEYVREQLRSKRLELSIMCVSFADALKHMCEPLIEGLQLQDKEEMRPIWQFVGEYARSLDPAFWIKHLSCDRRVDLVLIDDVRYENELYWLYGLGGSLVIVDAFERLKEKVRKEKKYSHPSENLAVAGVYRPFAVEDGNAFRLDNNRTETDLEREIESELIPWILKRIGK